MAKPLTKDFPISRREWAVATIRRPLTPLSEWHRINRRFASVIERMQLVQRVSDRSGVDVDCQLMTFPGFPVLTLFTSLSNGTGSGLSILVNSQDSCPVAEREVGWTALARFAILAFIATWRSPPFGPAARDWRACGAPVGPLYM